MKLQKFESVSRVKTWCQVLLILFGISEAASAVTHTNNSLANDEPYHFRSNINQIEYSISVNLPNNYDENSAGGYPVLYVLDGQWDFNLMVSLYHNLRFDNSIPDIIIVGIAYYGQNINYDSLRIVDMIPAKDYSPAGTGGAARFLEVLKKEIIPYVDDNYATNRLERCISGTSLAGFYSYYLMFQANDLFNGFIAVNPYLLWNKEVSFQIEQDYSMKNSNLNARVYMTTGEFDISDVFFKMIHQIKSRSYAGIDFDYDFQKGIGHTGSKHDGYSRGIIHLFKQKTVNLGSDYLKKYAGTYLSESRDTVNVVLDGENLVIQKSKTVPFDLKLYTLSDSTFCAAQNYVPFYLKEIPGKNIYEFSYDGFLHQLKASRSIGK